MGMAWNKTLEKPNWNTITFHPRRKPSCHVGTTGKTNLTTVKLPKLAVAPYAVVEWISKKGRTLNELRVLLKKWWEQMLITKKRIGIYYSHYQWRQHRWTQMWNNQCHGHGSRTSHRHMPKILEMVRQDIGYYIDNNANKIHIHEKKQHIKYWSVFLGNLTRSMGSGME